MHDMQSKEPSPNHVQIQYNPKFTDCVDVKPNGNEKMSQIDSRSLYEPLSVVYIINRLNPDQIQELIDDLQEHLRLQDDNQFSL